MGGPVTSLQFGFDGIRTVQFAVFNELYDPALEVGFKNNILLKADFKNKKVIVSVKGQYLHEGKSPFLVLEVACLFRIPPKSWKQILDEEKRTVTLPVGFARHLTVITVGALRGVQHAKTENTPFNMYTLPLLNLEKIMKKDIVITIKEPVGKK